MHMSWIYTSLQWYAMLTLIGIIFFPTAKKILGKVFYDHGYAFSKIIAILSISYTSFILSTFKLLPFGRIGLFFIIGFYLLINTFLFYRERRQSKKILIKKSQFFIILFEEILFLVALVFWIYVRGQEPSIKDLEKMMDFGFINSIVRSSFFPPSDMWFAGHTINYYYFGHLTGAVLTKLSDIPSVKTYNLILATLFALGITQGFSLCFTLIYQGLSSLNVHVIHQNIKKGKIMLRSFFGAIIGAFLLNFGGNLHTIYLFTKGYANDDPIPFWRIMSSFNPTAYWYPNATRLIPFTIHEFPFYSYVVADLHGHVFDIPFVLLTLSFLFTFFMLNTSHATHSLVRRIKIKQLELYSILFFGFLTAVHYMTNAFDGPIYLLLIMLILFLIYKTTRLFFISTGILIASFIVFSMPFSIHFSPFVSGIGVNCAPQFLIALNKIGPFLFEQGKCQISPLWMFMLLWGFFLFNFIFFLIAKIISRKNHDFRIGSHTVSHFVLVLFSLSTILLIIPEFFYIKDIYPAHFRANTMFKLGYQAFIMMSIGSTYAFIFFKQYTRRTAWYFLYFIFYILFFSLIASYPVFAISSYYGKLDKTPVLDGSGWVNALYPEYKEIITYLNTSVKGRPTILEAQGDSYTTYNVVSSYTGLPTVAGWWVHEWLWRGSSDAVGALIPDIETIYQAEDIQITINLIKKYHIEYVIIGSNEKGKYKNLEEEKFKKICTLIFSSSNKKGKIYQIKNIF